ncbi:MAG: hypothetical protein KIT62_13995 [Cyclobacteriaceae bacterium]|nr:hypothetical protein [Cyclobacteriaceae bacterium]
MEAQKDQEQVTRIRQKLGDELFCFDEEDEPAEECVHFYFLGNHEGQEVLFDCVLYTLRLHHEGEMHEVAEARAAKKLDEYMKAKDSQAQQEEELGMLMAEILIELEEEEAVKVREHVELDPENPVGVGIDAGLNVPVISNDVIRKFIAEFKAGTLKLDEALYSFQGSTDFEP